MRASPLPDPKFRKLQGKHPQSLWRRLPPADIASLLGCFTDEPILRTRNGANLLSGRAEPSAEPSAPGTLNTTPLPG